MDWNRNTKDDRARRAAPAEMGAAGEGDRDPVVFISHTTRSKRDRGLAQRLGEVLQDKGVTVWIAPDIIPVGDDWKEAIKGAILGQASHFLVILSAASKASPWVRREMALARRRLKRDPAFKIIPIRVAGVGSHRARGFISSLQEFTYKGNFEALLRELSRRLAVRLSTLFGPSVEGVLDELFRAGEGQRPFGGRSVELSALDRWFERKTGASHALLIAPLGRGKSTLLAHWVTKRLQGDPKEHVVYYPVRVARGMHRLPDLVKELAGQLARATNVQGSGDPGERIVAGLRRGVPARERLCVVIDALDELGDEFPVDLLPRSLGKNTRVLCAVRGSPEGDRAAWTKVLGWADASVDVVSLRPFDASQIGDVLRSAPAPLPRWAGRKDLCQALLQKSGGDPFTLGAYLTQLSAVVAKAEDPASVTPQHLLAYLGQLDSGLEGLFKSWRNDEKLISGIDPLGDARVRTFLFLCASAKAPLTVEAVMGSAPSMLGSPSDVDQVASIAHRLILRLEDDAFSVQHPALGAALLSRCDPGQVKGFTQCLIDYCRHSLERLRQASDDSKALAERAHQARYALRAFGAHLESVDAVDELFTTLCKPWLEGHLYLQGYPSYFLADCERLRALAERGARLGTMAAAILAVTTLHGVLGNPQTPELLLIALRAGSISLSHARELARKFGENRRGGLLASWRALSLLAEETRSSEDRKDLYETMADDIRYGRDISLDDDDERKLDFIIDLADGVRSEREFDRFRVLYDRLDDDADSSGRVRGQLISLWAARSTGAWRKKLVRDAEFIEDDEARQDALMELASPWRTRGEAQRFRRLIREGRVPDEEPLLAALGGDPPEGSTGSAAVSAKDWNFFDFARRMNAAQHDFEKLHVVLDAIQRAPASALGVIDEESVSVGHAGEKRIQRALVRRNYVPAAVTLLRSVRLNDFEARYLALARTLELCGRAAATLGFDVALSFATDTYWHWWALESVAKRADAAMAMTILRHARQALAGTERDVKGIDHPEHGKRSLLKTLIASLEAADLPAFLKMLSVEQDARTPSDVEAVLSSLVVRSADLARGVATRWIDQLEHPASLAAIVRTSGHLLDGPTMARLLALLPTLSSTEGTPLLLALLKVAPTGGLEPLAHRLVAPDDLANALVTLACRGRLTFVEALDALRKASSLSQESEVLRILQHAPSDDPVWVPLSDLLVTLGERSKLPVAYLKRCPASLCAPTLGKLLVRIDHCDGIIQAAAARDPSGLRREVLAKGLHMSAARLYMEEAAPFLSESDLKRALEVVSALGPVYDDGDDCDVSPPRYDALPRFLAALQSNPSAEVRRFGVEVALERLSQEEEFLCFVERLPNAPDSGTVRAILRRLAPHLSPHLQGHQIYSSAWNAACKMAELSEAGREFLATTLRARDAFPIWRMEHLPASEVGPMVRQRVKTLDVDDQSISWSDWKFLLKRIDGRALADLLDRCRAATNMTAMHNVLVNVAVRAREFGSDEKTIAAIARESARLDRAGALSVLAELSPCILTQEGEAGLARFLGTIAETASWWE